MSYTYFQQLSVFRIIIAKLSMLLFGFFYFIFAFPALQPPDLCVIVVFFLNVYLPSKKHLKHHKFIK